MTSTLIPTPRTAEQPPDPLSAARAALRTVPGVDTSSIRAAVQDGHVLLVGRVQWSSEAAAVGRHLRRVPVLHGLHNRIGFQYDDDPRHQAWRHAEP
ncbi:BON domain-containing protein [Actinokineospora guangxiensis]|uniref:BON domain-containing protein n=1 Tax=Actinokineospora guangxiensis TaxID=1490288 RepID=A0ABW0ELE1_9PSEU